MDNAMETTVTEQDVMSAFDDGWDENFEPGAGAETEETAEAQHEAEESGENQPAETEAAEVAEADSKDSETETKEEERFELNYMGTRETVGKNEVIALAQKGRDYDRIREERDSAMTELKELRAIKPAYDKYSDFLAKLAAAASTDVQGIMDNLNAKNLIAQEKARGVVLTEELALQKVKLERERAEFEAEKSSGKGAKSEQPADTAQAADPAEAKRRDDFLAFAKAFPDVDGGKIPQEVWDAYHAGNSLVAAYSLYENRQLKEQLAAKDQEIKNRERSTGSRASAGAGKEKDAFDLGWDID